MQTFIFIQIEKEVNSMHIYSINMINRSKKLTLNAPYSKISKALWENKKINSQKQKENLQLQTKVQHLHNSKSIKQHHGAQFRKLQEKYQKYSNKFKEQAKWIKDTNEMIEERKYEQLSNQVKKLQNKLNRVTQKAINSENKLKKYCKKMKKYEVIDRQANKEQQQTQYKSPYYELQNEKLELQTLLKSRQQHSQKIEQTNKELNKQLIELLAIKNKLRSEAKEWKQSESTGNRFSLCKPIIDLGKKESKKY